MARNKPRRPNRPSRGPRPGRSAAPAPPAAPARRDPRPYIYLAFAQLFAIGYAYLLVAVIPNRLPSGAAHLWALPVTMQIVALGTATVFAAPRWRRVGWWLVVAGCSVLVALTILLLIRIVISAAFLAGVYGAFGKAAAMSSLVAVALVIELVGLVPLLQLKYMRTRAGRRAYARLVGA